MGVSGTATMDPQGPRELEEDPADEIPPHGPNELLDGDVVAGVGVWP